MKIPASFKYLTPGWWLVHLLGMSLAYILGAIFWK